jgi:hypothetical protein
MRPIAAQRSSGLCMGWEHVDVRRVLPSVDSFGSQSPNVFLWRIGQIGHERRTSRRPWAFVGEDAERIRAETNDQWGIAPDRDSTYAVGAAVDRDGAEVRDVAGCCHNAVAPAVARGADADHWPAELQRTRPEQEPVSG